jgi:hypothetical protein
MRRVIAPIVVILVVGAPAHNGTYGRTSDRK